LKCNPDLAECRGRRIVIDEEIDHVRCVLCFPNAVLESRHGETERREVFVEGPCKELEIKGRKAGEYEEVDVSWEVEEG
jgi:hypothetical protein